MLLKARLKKAIDETGIKASYEKIVEFLKTTIVGGPLEKAHVSSS